jgi:methionyl-tRNA formyltransferase
LETVQAIDNQTVISLPQLDVAATHAPKIFQETCEIDFNKTTAEVHNFIRGLSPFPTAWTTLNGLKLKIFKAQKVLNSDAINDELAYEKNSDLDSKNVEKGTPQYMEYNGIPKIGKTDFEALKTGKFVTDGKNFLKIATTDGCVGLLDVQLEGRKRMGVRDFLNGYRV